MAVDWGSPVLLNESGAVCLNGSPGAFFVRRGDPSRWIIYLNGGGWCARLRGLGRPPILRLRRKATAEPAGATFSPALRRCTSPKDCQERSRGNMEGTNVPTTPWPFPSLWKAT